MQAARARHANAERWTRELAAWAIPPEILAAAPESPWGFPEGIFTAEAELTAWVRCRLCLPAARDAEIAALMAPRIVQEGGNLCLPSRRVVTLWWDGEATA